MPTDAQIRTALDTLGTHQLAAHECFGGAAAVLRDGEVICESYFGGDRFSDRALFRLASMTKLFTAAAVMKLAEDGRLNIEAPVSTRLCASEDRHADRRRQCARRVDAAAGNHTVRPADAHGRAWCRHAR